MNYCIQRLIYFFNKHMAFISHQINTKKFEYIFPHTKFGLYAYFLTTSFHPSSFLAPRFGLVMLVNLWLRSLPFTFTGDNNGIANVSLKKQNAKNIKGQQKKFGFT